LAEDFRHTRRKLPPDAFALWEGEDPEPTDLIDQATWNGIVHLPDDVSLRTSDHYGSLLKRAYEFWGDWIALVLDLQNIVGHQDALSNGTLVATDAFQVSLYLALTGFYREAIASLRSAIEAVVVGIYFRDSATAPEYERWKRGARDAEVWMAEARRAVRQVPPFSDFDGSNDANSLLGKEGWVTDLYTTLSGFSHGRPYRELPTGEQIPTGDAELRAGSNGPIFVPEAVVLWARFYFEAGYLCAVLCGIAEPQLRRIESPTERSLEDFLCHWRELIPAPLPPAAKRAEEYLVASPSG
jgi:hypothetical protein